MNEIIQIKDIEMDYNPTTRALDGITLEIEKGEWATIMGPSGSGKTTLLNIIGCLEKPTSGNVIVEETEVTALNQKQLTRFRRENFGFIFQQFHLVPYLTALENVMLSQYFLHGRKIKEEDAITALERVGLEHRMDHIPSHMSGGEQQRVSIARALVCEPAILLADEPTGNLDSKTGNVILELLKSLHSEGHTILMVTHDINIGRMGERIIQLIDGKISQDKQNSVEYDN
ncbi:MAG: ABC transporter ATP-binding protein [Thermoplasmata archaeon]|nr:MAG: ABC transporter ATP-binding protein [Thermoplasmata archaeon]